jgi:hypothetical protein
MITESSDSNNNKAFILKNVSFRNVGAAVLLSYSIIQCFLVLAGIWCLLGTLIQVALTFNLPMIVNPQIIILVPVSLHCGGFPSKLQLTFTYSFLGTLIHVVLVFYLMMCSNP